MLPIATNLRIEGTAWATYTIATVNTLIYFVVTWHTNFVLAQPIVEKMGFVPAYVPELNPTAIPTLFTSLFIHGDLLHLIGNMAFLLVFGRKTENQLGRKNYTVFYLICGITAAMTHAVVNPHSSEPLIGASGAISGVLGAFLVYNPRARITLIPDLLLIYLLRRFTIRVPASVFLPVWFLLQLYLGANPRSSNVAFWAHIGGFAMGATVAIATYSYIPKERFHATRQSFRR